MSKTIRMNKDECKSIVKDFIAYLKNDYKPGVIEFKKNISTNKKAKIHISEIAYQKMKVLVEDYTTEVGWHGIVRRHENSEAEFTIEDILLYPQIVSGVTVSTDQEKYNEWMFDLDDESFKNLRFHGHSHVNMGVSPSTTDTSWYKSLKEMLTDDDYYIFMILNKKGQCNIEVYDNKTNTIYENSDIEFIYPDCVTQAKEFVKSSKDMVANASAYSKSKSAISTNKNKSVNENKGSEESAKLSETEKTIYYRGYGYPNYNFDIYD